MNTNFASRGVLYAIGLITLSALSVPAFADSTEYRRGYDQGYRDGVENHDSQGQQRGSMGRIDIERARYGTRNASCNPEAKLQKAVSRSQQGNDWRRRSISIAANNHLCGDPAPNHTKQLDVSYRCGNGSMLRAQAREGNNITLNCRQQ